MAYDFPSSPATGDVYQPSGGPSWQWDGTAWKSFQANGEMAINRIAIPGPNASYIYAKPANLRFLEFEGVAAGGSGAPALATAAGTWAFGSGGGAGSWGKRLFTAAALPASVTIAIGAAGTPPSNGNAPTSANTTFGSLITLPGGGGGIQGANTLNSTSAVQAGGNGGGAPSGVDFGAPGQNADACLVGFSSPGGSAWAVIGASGVSPYGSGVGTVFGSGLLGAAGTGYGAGGSGALGIGAALRIGGQGAPGLVVLTEHLAVAPADVVAPLRQTFYPTGAAGQIIPVPPTAKRARVSGHVYAATQPMFVGLRMSADGVTFPSGASDYIYGGTILYTGSTASPTKVLPVTSAYIPMGSQTDQLNTPVIFDVDIIVNKTVLAHIASVRSRSWLYNSTATTSFVDFFYSGYPNVAVLNNALQFAALQFYPGTGTWAADTVITVDWIY